MAATLLTSVGFEWGGHPHRVFALSIGQELEGGVEVRGGPWSTGERRSDTVTPSSQWSVAPEIDGVVERLPSRQAEGERSAEVRWPLPAGVADVVAVTGFSFTSLSHSAGFNLAGFGVGVDPPGVQRRSAWLRVEAGGVPERPERFDRVVIEAQLTLAHLSAAPGAPEPSVDSVSRRERTASGFRPSHQAVPLSGLADGQTVEGLAGWSWTVENTARNRGRYLRSWSTAVTAPNQVEMLVSNRGEVTRATDLVLSANVVTVPAQ